jgi:AraC-like DNA-binding protein
MAGLNALGHDGRALLSACGIDHKLLTDSSSRFSQSSVMQLWHEAVSRTRDENLGLHLAEAAPLESFEIYRYTVLGSDSLREAFQRVCRYQRLVHESSVLELIDEEGGARLRHTRVDGGAMPRHPAEFLAASWMRFSRLLVASPWQPLQATFAHAAPRSLRDHRRIFGLRLRFDAGTTSVLFPAKVLDKPNKCADPALIALLDGYAASVLARLKDTPGAVGRVRAYLERNLCNGAPDAAAVAEALDTSVRTLHRQLRAEGTNLRRIFDALRHEQAVRLLERPTHSLAQVAFLLGFSEVSSFYRAFYRWTGTTPARFRARR